MKHSPLVIENQGFVLESSLTGRELKIACFPSLCVTTRGPIICGYQTASQKNAVDSTIQLSRSLDGGISWRNIDWCFDTRMHGVPGSLSNCEIIELDFGRLMLVSTWINRREPHRTFFDPVTEGILHTSVLRCFSSDNGNSWTAWREIPLQPPDLSHHSSGPLLRFTDGSIILLTETHKSFDGHGESWLAEGSWLSISSDQGESFSAPQLIAKHSTDELMYWDGRLCLGETPDSWIALYWTYSRIEQCDVSVRMQRGSLTDGHLTFLPPSDTHITAQISAPIFTENTGWISICINRDTPGTIMGWQSLDSGATWMAKLALYDHRASFSSLGGRARNLPRTWEEISKWCFGHPAIRIIDDDTALVVYYAGTLETMTIHWMRLKLGHRYAVTNG